MKQSRFTDRTYQNWHWNENMPLASHSLSIRNFRPVLWSAALILYFDSSAAFSKSLVDDYITAHGGCAALSRSWENEFHRPDKAPPFGKPFLDWDQDDFSVLRKWVGQCLNPYLVQRGHQEQFLQIYDSKVRVYQQ